MGGKIDMEVLAERLDAHRSAFEKRCEHDDDARRLVHDKLDAMAGQIGASTDMLHGRINRLCRAIATTGIGAGITAIGALVSIVGYLLVEGVPWQ